MFPTIRPITAVRPPLDKDYAVRMSKEGSRSNPTVLFVHGAGGFDEDGPLASGLVSHLGADLVMPKLSDTDMSFEGWAAPIRSVLAGLGPDDLVIGHSFGASILVGVLAERGWAVQGAVLLAMPNWGPEGWDVKDYAFDGPAPPQSLTLHHCVDDAVVPFSHLALNSRALPDARAGAHAEGGHQFEHLTSALLG